MMTNAGRCFTSLTLVCALTATASSSVAATADMVSEFSRTCVASRSVETLKQALSIGGWKVFETLSKSHLEREINAVTPMLEAQGLASDYVIYGRDVAGQHLELALSETKSPVSAGRKLIGCSLYDFEATDPIDSTLLSTLASTIVSQKSKAGDVQVEKWDNVFGEGSGMRAVFVPASSPMGVQLGFTGMMLGTHFLDPSK